MAAIKSKAIKSSGPPPLPGVQKYHGPMPPPLPHKRNNHGPSPFSRSSPDSQPISGIRKVGKYQQDVEDPGLSFHDWGQVIPGVMRASCVAGLFSMVVIRIRTSDNWPDHGLIERIAKVMERSDLEYVTDVLAASTREHVFIHLNPELHLYEIFMQGIPAEKLAESKRIVGCVAAYFFQSKEAPLIPLL